MGRFRFLFLLGVVALTGCDLAILGTPISPAPVGIDNNLQPTPTLAGPLLSPLPSPTPQADSGWERLRPGLERRRIRVDRGETSFSESLYLLRIDPAFFNFDVAYRPGRPLSLEQWQAETGALVVVNGGFFTAANEATGLIIVNGQPSGSSYTDFGGMFAVGEAGPELRWLPNQPYIPGENLSAALQSFPMLVKPGPQPGYANQGGEPARRTVIGQDRDGRIIFVIAAGGTFSLTEMSRFLLLSDLELVMALNLDGGASSGLLLADPAEGIGAYALLPAVITVDPK